MRVLAAAGHARQDGRDRMDHTEDPVAAAQRRGGARIRQAEVGNAGRGARRRAGALVRHPLRNDLCQNSYHVNGRSGPDAYEPTVRIACAVNRNETRRDQQHNPHRLVPTAADAAPVSARRSATNAFGQRLADRPVFVYIHVKKKTDRGAAAGGRCELVAAPLTVSFPCIMIVKFSKENPRRILLFCLIQKKNQIAPPSSYKTSRMLE
ncbi:hypothetical protein EVAR_45578_1 [Eumeta japonica]|uniref:Uncharacterized protein n=1 Tax=Eumeta variegata TaxID=151549 RepID=A0A4C1YVN2_EUMVA|nr:hypothetical protein EVAR_45578_1 [Eumeta japonica]